MEYKRFNEVLETTVNKCIDTLSIKSNEYATEDRLHNFKVAAEIQNCTPITALAGMMAKHTVSVYDLIQRQENGFVVSREMWDEKIGDSINYLILLSALVQEKFDEDAHTEWVERFENNTPTLGEKLDREYTPDSSVDLHYVDEHKPYTVKFFAGLVSDIPDRYRKLKCAKAVATVPNMIIVEYDKYLITPDSEE